MTKIMRTRGIAFLLAFIMVFCTVYFTVQTPVIAYAQESETYSGVLDDLKKDKSFDAGVFSIITVFLFSVNKKGSGRLTDIRRSLVFSPNRCCTPDAQPSFFFHKVIIYCFCLGSQYFSQ